MAPDGLLVNPQCLTDLMAVESDEVTELHNLALERVLCHQPIQHVMHLQQLVFLPRSLDAGFFKGHTFGIPTPLDLALVQRQLFFPAGDN